MNHIERITNALEHKPVDKVPKGELGMHGELIRKLVGCEEVKAADYIAAANKLKMDFVNHWCAGTEETLLGADPAGNSIAVDKWGSVRRRSQYSDEIIETAIKDVEDTKKLVFPELSEYYSGIQRIMDLRRMSDLFVMGQTEGVFTPMSWLYGFEAFMENTCVEPEIVKDFAFDLAEHYALLAARLAEAGAHAIVIADDIAFNTGTFMSPRSMRELVFPALKAEVSLIKKLCGLPVAFHSDGDLRAVMDDIVDCGFDALQSLQPTANMDLADIKARYGRKMCLIGNIDINEVLPFAGADTVRKVVRQTIEAGIPGSGYILSTCNILTRDIPVENAIAMYDEAERHEI
jgi:uroporphyrinogen decarboxylase